MDTRELSGDGNVLKLDCGDGCTNCVLKLKKLAMGAFYGI